jgi:hypothetical protein
MPAPLDTAIVERVKNFWGKNAHPLGAKGPSRRSLYEQYKRAVKNELSWGAFSNIVKKLEQSVPEERFEERFSIAPWKPWADPQENPEDTAFLLQISAVMQADIGRDPYNIEAKWARRLRVALEGLYPFAQYRMIISYTSREIAAYYLKEDLYTTDLDNFLAYKPWFLENQQAYNIAVLSGSAHYPNLDTFNDFTDPPEEIWEDLVKRYGRTPWWYSIEAILIPWGTNVPDKEKNPEKAQMLDWLLQFWARRPKIPQANATDEPSQSTTTPATTDG